MKIWERVLWILVFSGDGAFVAWVAYWLIQNLAGD
jgi:hypothetical protein